MESAEHSTGCAAIDNNCSADGASARLKTLVDEIEQIGSLHKTSAVFVAPLVVAVSKTVDSAAIEEVYRSGHRHFGENRVPVLVEKARQLRHLSDISWHFIGRLQRNKIRKIISIVSLIHSVDSVKLGSAISRICIEEDLEPMKILLEVNVSGEQSKAGFCEDELDDALEELALMKGISLEGFMTMAPFTDDSQIIRDTFRRLAGISKRYCASGLTGGELSMGMTNDYPIAVEEGATIIRVGSKIFSKGQV